MGERQITVDGNGVAGVITAAYYLRHEELVQLVPVDDDRGEIEAPVVEPDIDDFPRGVVVCHEERGIWLMDPDDPSIETRTRGYVGAYYMDLVGRIVEISTGRYVTGRRDTFRLSIDILERFEADQTDLLH